MKDNQDFFMDLGYKTLNQKRMLAFLVNCSEEKYDDYCKFVGNPRMGELWSYADNETKILRPETYSFYKCLLKTIYMKEYNIKDLRMDKARLYKCSKTFLERNREYLDPLNQII